MGCCQSILSLLFGHDPDNPQDIDPILDSSGGGEEQQPLDVNNEESNLGYWVNGVFRPLNELTLEEQTNLARKIEFLDQMPSTVVDNKDKIQECVICMVDIGVGEVIRYLPCAHLFHKNCVDTWLMRNLSCPTCMEELTEVKEYLSNSEGT